jgi:uncharacterized protein involved in exopolysaccharide biosynthesis
MIVVPPVALAALGLGYVLLFGSYQATASLTVESGGLGSIAGLAAQFGVNVPGGLGGTVRSLDFQVSALQSPELLERVASTTYRFPRTPGGNDSLTGTLYQLYGVKGDTPEEARWRMVKRLGARVQVGSDRLAQIITIRTKAPWPALAQQINRRMIDLLNEANTSQRQSQASAQRAFIQQRLAAAQEDLLGAESVYQRFLEQNRQYESSPRLTFEAARLQRRIDLRQQVYTTLAQSFEQASIEEVRDTPVITVLEPPELLYKRSRSPVVVGFTALIFGMACTITAAFLMEAYWVSELRTRASLKSVTWIVSRFRQT